MPRQFEKSKAETYSGQANDPERVKETNDLRDADSTQAAAYAVQCEIFFYRANDGNAGPRTNIKQVAEEM